MKINYASIIDDPNIYEKYHTISNLIENYSDYDQDEIKYVNNTKRIITIADVKLDGEIYSFLRFKYTSTTYQEVYDLINNNEIYDFLEDEDLPCSNDDENKNEEQLDILKDILKDLKNEENEVTIPNMLNSNHSTNLLILSKDKQFTKINKDTASTSGDKKKMEYADLDLGQRISGQNEFLVVMVKLKPLTFKLETNKLQIEKGGELTLSDEDYSSNGTVTFENDNTENGYNKKLKIVSKNFSDLKMVDEDKKLFENNTINVNKVGSYNVKDLNGTDIVVKVIDTTPPIINVLGSKNLTLERGSLYRDRGATSDNNEKINVNTNLIMDEESGKYILNQVGDHTIKYTAYDEEGNIGTATRVINVEDTIGPEIVLIGNEEINHERGLVYKDEGAYTVLGKEVEAEGEVDYNEPGNYKITYSSVDEYGNKSKSIRNINVIDTIPPKISVEGEESVTLEKNSKYKDLGAYTLDKDVDNKISVENKINENKVGDYFVIYSVSDKSGNVGTTKRKVKVIDTTPPEIKLNGKQVQNVEYNSNNGIYIDPEASIVGEDEAEITTYGNVNVNFVDDYELKYVAEDKFGNKSFKTRTVKVRDTTKPILTLNGEEEITLEKGDTYQELKANSDNNEEVTISGTVDTSKVGEYTITYEAVDKHDNKGIATRKVIVEDTTAPVIDVIGGDVEVERYTKYIDGEVKLKNNEKFNIIRSGTVDTSEPGNYYITYISTDDKLNIGTARRRVRVVDNTSPTIDLLGEPNVKHQRYLKYNDRGATFKDSGIEMNKNKVKVESNVDVNTIGKYLVTYTATDESGNKTQASREVEVIDTIAPKFSLESEEDLDIKKFKDDIIERGQTYQLPKFKTDTRDGIEKIIKYIDDEKNTFDVNEIDTKVTGEYEVTLKSTDEAGNIGYSLKKVIVKDTTRPEIKLIGDAEVTIERGEKYEDRGAEYSDNNLPLDKKYFKTETNLNIHVQGDYLITYTVTDQKGLKSSITRKVKVSDRTAPKIKLKGDNPTIVEKGKSYKEEGATSDGGENVESSGYINTNVVNDYIITYKTEDEYENESSVERIVKVVDTTPPEIKLIGEETVTIEKGTKYKDEGALTLNNEDLKIENNVNEEKVGSYFVIYSAVDSYNNEGTSKRTVNVIDTTPPSLNLVGDYEIKIEKGMQYVEEGATSDSSNKIEVSGNVNTQETGTYKVKYVVFDENDNKTEMFRTVKVVDTIKPIITIKGPEKVQIQKGQTYYDIGAKSDSGEEVIVDNQVDTSKTGIYKVNYKAFDKSGNEGIASRTIEVIDTIAPVIKVLGDNPKTIFKGTVYQDDGVSVIDDVRPIVSNNVDFNKIGTYFVSYKVKDSSGNESSAIRIVNVIKNPNKKVTLNPELDEILMEEEGGGVTLYVIILIVLVIAIILFFYYN